MARTIDPTQLTPETIAKYLAAATESPTTSPKEIAVIAAAQGDLTQFTENSPALIALQNLCDGLTVVERAALENPAPTSAATPAHDPALDRIRAHFAADAKLFWECRTNPTCKRTPQPTAPACPDCTFAWADAFPGGFDYVKLGTFYDDQVVAQISEGLLVLGPDAGTAYGVAGAASGYSVSPDGRTYTFAIRPEAKWSDGIPVTAADFAFSYLRTLHPKTGARTVDLLYPIDNAEAYNKGDITDPAQVGIRVVNEHTLEIRLQHPDPLFPIIVAVPAYLPVPKHVIDQFGEAAFRPEHLVSNGPYRVTSFKERDQIVFEKNPYYWDAANVEIPHLVLYHSENTQTAYDWFQLGKVDYVRQVPPGMEKAIAEKYPAEFKIADRLAHMYLGFNEQVPPFDNAETRRKICQSIDKRKLVQAIGGGRRAAASFVHPTFAKQGYTTLHGLEFDPFGDKNIAGVGTGPFRISYATDDLNRQTVEILQRQLSEHGITVAAENKEFKTLVSELHAGNYQLARIGWVADYPDPSQFLIMFTSGHPNNYFHYSNPSFDKLMRAAAAATDIKHHYALLAQAEAIVLKDAPACPLYHDTAPRLVSSKLRHFTTTYTNTPNLRFAGKAED